MDIKALEQQAIDYARRGDFGADARKVNEELTRAVPTNEGAWTRLARCNIELGLLDDASAALEAALQVNPQNTIARSLLQETIRRQVRAAEPEPAPRRKAASRGKAAPAARVNPRAAFGRAQFAALEQLDPAAAVDAVGGPFDALLKSLNARPFAAKVVEARNRAGKAGSRLFRRDSLQPGAPGHVYVHHHGGRAEPQLNIGLFAGGPYGAGAMRAGIGFDLRTETGEADHDPEAAAAYFERFQQLVSRDWKGLLTDWMSAKGGFIQYGDEAVAADLQPSDAVEWLISSQAATHKWIFVGRWLFARRPTDGETMEDAGKLLAWTEAAFVDLLPLWMSVYRR